MLISLGPSLTDYRNFRLVCESYASLSLAIFVMNLIWILVAAFAVYTTYRKKKSFFNIYIVGMSLLAVIRIVISGMIISQNNDESSCINGYYEDSSGTTTTVIGTIVTLVILVLFIISALRLKSSLKGNSFLFLMHMLRFPLV